MLQYEYIWEHKPDTHIDIITLNNTCIRISSITIHYMGHFGIGDNISYYSHISHIESHYFRINDGHYIVIVVESSSFCTHTFLMMYNRKWYQKFPMPLSIDYLFHAWVFIIITILLIDISEFYAFSSYWLVNRYFRQLLTSFLNIGCRAHYWFSVISFMLAMDIMPLKKASVCIAWRGLRRRFHSITVIFSPLAKSSFHSFPLAISLTLAFSIYTVSLLYISRFITISFKSSQNFNMVNEHSHFSLVIT